ncbi:MAG: hypothetical protein HC793_04210 [Aquincola sp.]|nr:hypothetical protein [Aquincola sp.]
MDPLASLDKSIRRAHVTVQGIAIVAIATYMIWFWLLQDLPLSDSGAVWGVFGDFLGGLLNPVVAYAAFYWLTQSVRIQKQELADTRAALTEAATAQTQQVELSRATVQLSALSALANTSAAEIRFTQTEIQFVVDQLARDPQRNGARSMEGQWLTTSQVDEYLVQKKQRIRNRLDQQASA